MWLPLQLLSVTLWALANVLDSLLVQHFEKHPIVPMWFQSIFLVLVLTVLSFFFDVHTAWMLPLIAVGIIAWAGDFIFWRALAVIDVSVTNIAWAILSVFLTLSGFLLLHERWTLAASIGALFVILGISLLSTWHKKVSSMRSLLYLPLLAALYAPFYIVQKMALVSGEHLFPVFYWAIFSREMCSFLSPLLVPGFRRTIAAFIPRSTLIFHSINFVVVLIYFFGIYFTTQAFAHGPISLVSIVGNVQPFLVLFFAWILWKIAPRYASKELLTQQSVLVKLVSFLLVFVGLAFLGLTQ